jgi:hypothetical protein
MFNLFLPHPIDYWYNFVSELISVHSTISSSILARQDISPWLLAEPRLLGANQESPDAKPDQTLNVCNIIPPIR